MDKMLRNIEKKLGRFAIRNLPLYMIICYGIGYIMEVINPQVIYAVSLNPDAILHGQVWRIFTWLLIPPNMSNIFFTLITFYFYYSIGTTLERTWGTFYFNYYIFSGVIYTLIGAFLYYGFQIVFNGEFINAFNQYYTVANGNLDYIYGGNWYFAVVSTAFSTYYISMSIFLAFAATFPDAQVLLFFILPIKVKILGIIYGVILVYEAFTMGVDSLFVIFASLLNFIIFFFTTRRVFNRNLNNLKRNIEKKLAEREEKREKMQPVKFAKHKCAICHRTDETNPELQFRFCSKCEGNYEYCQDHLFSHQHKTR